MDVIKTDRSSFSLSELISIATTNFNRLSAIQDKIEKGVYDNDPEKVDKLNRITSKLCARILKINPTLHKNLKTMAYQAKCLDNKRKEKSFNDEYYSFMNNPDTGFNL